MAAPSVARPDDLPFLDRLGSAKRALLLKGSRTVAYPAGSVVLRPGDPAKLAILEMGIARAYLSSPDGRQVTMRYIQPGEMVGAMLVFDQPWAGSGQLMTDSSLCYLDLAGFRRLFASDVEVAGALAMELAIRLARVQQILGVQTFGSVAQRLAFDLLERCCREQLVSGRLQTHASQQELADSIGSVREVAARALRELRDQGVIEVSRRHVRVLKPIALTRLVSAAFSGS
jgi:CRP/FNR family transcriptional regulator, cyclic AMP receptor protein